MYGSKASFTVRLTYRSLLPWYSANSELPVNSSVCARERRTIVNWFQNISCYVLLVVLRRNNIVQIKATFVVRWRMQAHSYEIVRKYLQASHRQDTQN